MKGLVPQSRARKAADSLVLVARVAALSFRLPRRPDRLWDAFWHGVSQGFLTEPVIWEAGATDEIGQHLERMAGTLNPGLPIVDVGCGSGAISRRLTEVFPSVLGVDVSPEAVAAARAANAETGRLAFRTVDATRPDAVEAIAGELGDANVFVRGVFHVLGRRRQARLVRSVEVLLGEKGRIYLVESNVPGGALNYLRSLGATGKRIPGPLRQAISTLPKPGHFGAAQRSRVFPPRQWAVLAEGPGVLETVPMEPGGPRGQIPAYWAVLARRPEASGNQTTGNQSSGNVSISS